MVRRMLVVGLLIGGASAVAAQEVERVLLPILANSAGAFGSQWTFDVFVHNENDRSVLIGGLRVADSPGLPPHITVPLLVFPREQAPPGQFVTLLAEDADRVSFQLHVRDISRQTSSRGTQIPVVRDRSFRIQITLPNIPVEDGFRQTLRIYTQGEATSVKVRIAALEGIQSDLVSEEIAIASTGFTGLPGYAEIGGFTTRYPQLAMVDRIRVIVESTSRIWAFASITNNVTQEVTIFAPSD